MKRNHGTELPRNERSSRSSEQFIFQYAATAYGA
jgi:hypothetical protein